MVALGPDHFLFISYGGGGLCHKVQDAIKDYNAELAVLFTEKPSLVLSPGNLGSEPWKPIGKCMILDDAHTIKNRNTRTFAAVNALRGQFEGCLTLTGTPLDNTWEGGYALPRLLEGHPSPT